MTTPLLVKDAMHARAVTLSPHSTLTDAVVTMQELRVKRLPVVQDGRVVGMISMRDLMAWASLAIRSGGTTELDEVDTAELLATINRMRTGAA